MRVSFRTAACSFVKIQLHAIQGHVEEGQALLQRNNALELPAMPGCAEHGHPGEGYQKLLASFCKLPATPSCCGAVPDASFLAKPCSLLGRLAAVHYLGPKGPDLRV